MMRGGRGEVKKLKYNTYKFNDGCCLAQKMFISIMYTC